MFRDEPLEPKRAEHFAVRVVGLNQPVAVEQDAVTLSQEVPALFVSHAGHQAKGHFPRSELLSMVTTPQVGQIMSGIGVSEASALWIQERVEAGDEHIGWDGADSASLTRLSTRLANSKTWRRRAACRKSWP